jgi:hypothetical protein
MQNGIVIDICLKVTISVKIKKAAVCSGSGIKKGLSTGKAFIQHVYRLKFKCLDDP